MSFQQCRAPSHEATAPTAENQLDAARSAINHLLRRLSASPDLAYQINPATQTFELLARASALLNGDDPEEFRARLSLNVGARADQKHYELAAQRDRERDRALRVTLPRSTTPLVNQLPKETHGALYLGSRCGNIRRSFNPQHHDRYPAAPIGTWWGTETRTDDTGQEWIKHTPGEYFVVDNFGNLVAARRMGGAA